MHKPSALSSSRETVLDTERIDEALVAEGIEGILKLLQRFHLELFPALRTMGKTDCKLQERPSTWCP